MLDNDNDDNDGEDQDDLTDLFVDRSEGVVDGDEGETDDEDKGDQESRKALDADDLDDDYDSQGESADDEDEDSEDESEQDEDDDESVEATQGSASNPEPAAAPNPLQQQLAALQAQVQQLVPLAQLGYQAQQQQLAAQQQPPPPPQIDEQVRGTLAMLFDVTRSREEVNAALAQTPIHVRERAAEIYRGHVRRQADQALGVEPSGQSQAMQAHVQQAVEQALQPLREQLEPLRQQRFADWLATRHRDVIQTEGDMRWVMERVAGGSRPDDAVELLRVSKEREQVDRKAKKADRQTRDARANKKSSRAKSSRGRRRKGKRHAEITEDMDLESIAERVMATGDDDLPDGLVFFNS